MSSADKTTTAFCSNRVKIPKCSSRECGASQTERVMASLVRSGAWKSLKNGSPSESFFNLRRLQTLRIRLFSATMSPPSKAVVYEEHGPPDSVTRSTSFALTCSSFLDIQGTTKANNLTIVLLGRVVELLPVDVKQNDVCVRMLAAPINPSDINRIEGFLFPPYSCFYLFIFCFLNN